MVLERNAAATTQTTAPINHTRPSPRKISPDGAAVRRKQTSDYSLLLSLSTSKGWKAESTCLAGHVTHPSTNRARRKVTLLIRPTPLPLCHAANPIYYHFWTHPFWGYYIMHELVLLCINQHTKFEVPSFINSKDMLGGKM